MALNEKSLKNLQPAQLGEVRNPKGKPLGTLAAKTIIRKWLNGEIIVENPLTGQMEQLTALDIATLKQIQKAMQGDTPAYRELMDRTEGKVTQAIEIAPKKDLSEMSSVELGEVSTEEIIRYLEETREK